MKHSEFEIGKPFTTGSGLWICTDIGKRTIVAVKKERFDTAVLKTPPFDIEESVFDEYDIQGCEMLEDANLS